MGDISDYFPIVIKNPAVAGTGKRGTGSWFTQKRKMTVGEHTETDINRIMWLNQSTREEAIDMLKRGNLSSVNMDVKEALLARGIAQTKMAQRVNIVEQFKELGIPISEMNDTARRALMHGIDDPKLGLKTLERVHPDLEGLLFDYETATVIEHALNLTGPKNINSVQQLFQKFTSFWKGIVTMTPGFHLRNFYSNQITQFMKHGSAAMDPRKMTDSLVGVLYALDKTNLKKAAADFGLDEGLVAKVLNHRYGNFSVKELADEGMRRNVISTRLMGQDPADIAESISKTSIGKKINPMGKDFAGRKASRWMGERVENLARFQSFMMDYGDAAARGLDNVTMKMDDEALSYAAMEAKKWFLDYGDLSDFEQGTLKQAIPFYAWLRKNIANQVQAIVLYPELFSMVPKLEEFFTYEHPDYDEDLIPPWMKQMGMFPTGKLEDGSFRMFNPNFPYQDLNKIPLVWEEDRWLPRLSTEEAKRDIVGAMNPLIRSFVSGVMMDDGYNFFYQNELGETGDAPYLMRLVASNPGIIGMVDGIQRARGLESGMGIDENGKLQINAKVAQLLEQNMPLLKWAEMMFYMPADLLIPGLEDFIQEKTGAVDSYEGIEETLQFMSRWLGIKFKSADLETLKMELGRDIYYRSQDILREQKSAEPGAEIRRMDYRGRTDQTIRRLLG